MDSDKELSVAESSYEFTAEQNDDIHKLSVKMKSVGMFFMVVGVISVAFAMLNFLSSRGIDFLFPIICGFIFIITGNLTISASKSFKLIVVTEGNDIDHLMKAITSMYKIYKIQYTMIIGAAILLVLILWIFFITGSLLHKF